MTGSPLVSREREGRAAHPRQGAAFSALLAFLLFLLLWWQGTSWYEAQVRAQLRAEERAEAAIEVTLQGNVLSSILNRRFARLQGLVAFAQAVPEGDSFSRQFTRFASTLYSDSQGVRNFALAPGGEVQYVYPLVGNEDVVGYRPLADPRPEVRADAQRAVESGEIVLSGPVELLQGGLGLIARAPVYRDGSFWGLANVVLDLPTVLVEAGLTAGDGSLTYAVRDSRGNVFWGDPRLFTREPVLSVVPLPEGTWELAGVPVSGWETAEPPQLTLIRATGLALVFLLATIVYLTVNRQARLRLAVTERTADLAEINLRLEERVADRTRELERLHEEAEAMAILRERQRLARELHDSVAQALYGINLGTRTARMQIERGKTEKVEESLTYVQELADGAAAEMRALIFELRPEALEREGLAAVLRRQAEAMHTRHRLEVETALCEEPPVSLPVKEALYRITQEALNNVVKHARAKHVTVEMTCDPDLLGITVRDDGTGFDPRQTYPDHLGLQTMRERVEQLGGTLSLNSAPGQGTTVEAQIPLT